MFFFIYIYISPYIFFLLWDVASKHFICSTSSVQFYNPPVKWFARPRCKSLPLPAPSPPLPPLSAPCCVMHIWIAHSASCLRLMELKSARRLQLFVLRAVPLWTSPLLLSSCAFAHVRLQQANDKRLGKHERKGLMTSREHAECLRCALQSVICDRFSYTSAAFVKRKASSWHGGKFPLL